MLTNYTVVVKVKDGPTLEQCARRACSILKLARFLFEKEYRSFDIQSVHLKHEGAVVDKRMLMFNTLPALGYVQATNCNAYLAVRIALDTYVYGGGCRLLYGDKKGLIVRWSRTTFIHQNYDRLVRWARSQPKTTTDYCDFVPVDHHAAVKYLRG